MRLDRKCLDACARKKLSTQECPLTCRDKQPVFLLFRLSECRITSSKACAKASASPLQRRNLSCRQVPAEARATRNRLCVQSRQNRLSTRCFCRRCSSQSMRIDEMKADDALLIYWCRGSCGYSIASTFRKTVGQHGNLCRTVERSFPAWTCFTSITPGGPSLVCPLVLSRHSDRLQRRQGIQGLPDVQQCHQASDFPSHQSSLQ